MGFVRDFVEGVVDTVTYVVEEAKEKVEEAVNAIFGGTGGGCISSSSGSSESEHATKIAGELAKMKEKMDQSTRGYEEKIMEYVNRSMDSFMKAVESLNEQTFGGEALHINVEAITEKNEKLKTQVIGCLGKTINERLVQTDRELSAILEERDDKKRNEAFHAFVKRVQKDAIIALKKEIETTVRAQSEVISSEIETRQKEVNARLEESAREFTEILEMKERNDAELQQKQFGYMYESALCDFLLREVGGQGA